MKGNQEIIDLLNGVLTRELTAINQYFLHARMFENWGLHSLGAHEYAESIDEMKHADECIKRILFLEGLPNLQKLMPLRIGQSPKEALECDLLLEQEAIPFLTNAIDRCEQNKDFGTRDLLQKILNSEEEHLDWLETQLGRIGLVGLENYLQSQLGPHQPQN